MAYTAYVASAYVITFGTVLALIVWGLADRRAARRDLGRAERAAERTASGSPAAERIAPGSSLKSSSRSSVA